MKIRMGLIWKAFSLLMLCIGLIFSSIKLLSCSERTDSAEALLTEVDRNLTSETLKYHLVMEIIYSPGDQRTVEADVWAVGRDSVYLEYTAPARERGTRYLKIGKSLWIHQPKLSRSVLIQGHMLRQGVFGSDFSYEDMLESGHLLDDYTAEFLPDEETLRVLKLTAKSDEITYQQRILWIDEELKIPRRSELRTRYGKPLKTVELDEIRAFGERLYPTRIVMKDLLKQKSSTVMRIVDPIFDVRIDPQTFTRRHLERPLD